MKKTFPIVMLPTKMIVGNQLILQLGNNKLSISHKHCIAHYSNEVWKGQHLYILSDEQPKDGDWCIREYYPPTKGFTRIVEQFIRSKADFGDSLSRKKIVATTDKSLTISATELLKLDTEYKEEKVNTSLPQIPESFIQAYIKAYNESPIHGGGITEVDLEIEYLSGEDIKFEDLGKFIIKTRPDNTVIVHQSKMYSRNEVESLIELAWASCSATTYKVGDDIGADCKSWMDTHL